MAMVVREFIRRQITPLQRHSRPMWAFTGREDPMRLQVASLPPNMLNGMLRLLTGGEASVLPRGGLPLYDYTSGKDFAKGMSRFDE